jgi:hypothetical protein
MDSNGMRGRIIDDPCGAGQLLGSQTDTGELSWTLIRRDGTTQHLGTANDMLDQIDELKARNEAIDARRDELVTEWPTLKAVTSERWSSKRGAANVEQQRECVF